MDKPVIKTVLSCSCLQKFCTCTFLQNFAYLFQMLTGFTLTKLICNRLQVLFPKVTGRWRARVETDVLWHTGIYWPCISQTHTYTPLMQYINCTIRIWCNKVRDKSMSKAIETERDCHCLSLERKPRSKRAYPGLQ